MIALNALTLANLLLIYLVIRRRGLWSPEGLGLGLLSVAVASDWIGLHWYLATSEYSFDHGAEVALRLYPGVVLGAGLLALALGLFVFPADRNYPGHSIKAAELSACGKALFVLGLAMKLYAIYAWGFSSIFEYIANTYSYDVQKQGGGFLDQGLLLATMGVLLIMSTSSTSKFRRMILGFVILAISFLLSSSKSGLNTAIIAAVVVFSAIEPKLLREVRRPLTFALIACVFFLGLGIKTQIKYGGTQLSTVGQITFSEIAESSALSLSSRFSAFGNYRGFCNLVTRIDSNPELKLNGRATEHLLAGWVPRFLWPDKPEHPFHAAGLLVNDAFVVDQYGNDAPTLVGSAFADFGFWGAIATLFLGGLFLGWVRRGYSANCAQNSSWIVAWCFFTIQMGMALPESGFLGVIYYAIFAVVVGLFCECVLRFRSAGTSIRAHAITRTSIEPRPGWRSRFVRG